MKPLLRDIIPDLWAEQMRIHDEPAYRGRQLAHWLYRRHAVDFDSMHNLPEALRRKFAAFYDASGLTISERLVSSDGTRKFLFRLRDQQLIESVLIPMQGHATICVSSQIGCAMACRFCATARGGLSRNLSCGEIIEQVQRLAIDLQTTPYTRHGNRGYNVVFMGMGEPLDNREAVVRSLSIMASPSGLGLSPRRLQISTSGPLHGLDLLEDLDLPVGLTISLGGADDTQRRRLMPVPGKAGVDLVLAAAERFARRTAQKVTIAWVLIADRTDDPTQARKLASLLRKRPFKVNLIPLNTLDRENLAAATAPRTLAFQRVLTEAGVPAFIRASGGQDIDAACGQLRRRRMAPDDSGHADQS
jgi:23S rRNA (adenine2503-C2)-methyltransferase